jgi:hypothetical protein
VRLDDAVGVSQRVQEKRDCPFASGLGIEEAL